VMRRSVMSGSAPTWRSNVSLIPRRCTLSTLLLLRRAQFFRHRHRRASATRRRRRDFGLPPPRLSYVATSLAATAPALLLLRRRCRESTARQWPRPGWRAHLPDIIGLSSAAGSPAVLVREYRTYWITIAYTTLDKVLHTRVAPPLLLNMAAADLPRCPKRPTFGEGPADAPLDGRGGLTAASWFRARRASSSCPSRDLPARSS
jgi:hypothetical protein